MYFKSYLQNNKTIVMGFVFLLLICGTYYLYSRNKFHIYDTMTDSSIHSAYHYTTDALIEPVPSTNNSTMDPSELLPNNHDSKWTALNPINEKSMSVPDVLQSDFFIGINTVGSSKKNPNLQCREDPYIAKVDTSGQWNNNSNDMR